MKKSDILLVTVSVIFSVYVAETILYIAEIQPYTDFRRGYKGDQPFKDKRSKARFVYEARNDGIKMVPDIPPHTFIKSNGLLLDGTSVRQESLFPLGGIANRPTAYCNVYGERLVYQSDKYGFRNPNSVYDAEHIDVVIAGDSFSAGHCEENDIGSLLRQKGLNTLNLAYGGNGPLIELASLREYGVDSKAKVLLWIYFEGNDLKNVKQESHSTILMNYLDPTYTQSLKSKQASIDELLNQRVNKHLIIELNKEKSKYDLNNLVFLNGLRFHLRRFHIRAKRIFYPLEEFEPYLSLISKVLARAKTDFDTWDGQMYFVYLPQRERYGGPVNELRLHTYRPQILDIVRKLNIPIIDFGDILDNIDDPRSYFPYGVKGHYNQEGYELLSELIQTRLRQHTGARYPR